MTYILDLKQTGTAYHHYQVHRDIPIILGRSNNLPRNQQNTLFSINTRESYVARPVAIQDRYYIRPYLLVQTRSSKRPFQSRNSLRDWVRSTLQPVRY